MTTLKYMDNQELLNDSATVASVVTGEDSTALILDATVFYPQGGGSPYDQGYITSANGARFRVEQVRFIDGEVHHIGSFEEGSLSEGDSVELAVDAKRRDMIAKLQSGGHLVDMAMREIGLSDLTPDKGFHFPEGPSVEYKGVIDPEDREETVKKLQEALDVMIAKGYEVQVRMSTKEEASEICYFVPEYFPEDKPIRIVAVWNDEYMPCGAIHVRNISDLKGLKVAKIKAKKGNTRVNYVIE